MNILLNLQKSIESIQDSFRLGVRKSILIFCGIGIVLIIPMYYLSASVANWWFFAPFNPFGLQQMAIVQSKLDSKIDVKIKDAGTSLLTSKEKILMMFMDNSANPNFGYNPLVYKKQVLDSTGKLISEKIEKSYLLPSQIKYIATTTDNINASKINLEILPESKLTEFNSVANPLLSNINIEIRDKSIKDTGDSLQIKASVKNNSNFVIKRIDLTLLIRDTLDSIVGVQITGVNDIQPQFTQEVIFDYPKPVDKVIRDNLDVRYDINILDPNII